MSMSSRKGLARYTLMLCDHAILDFEYDQSAQRVTSVLRFYDLSCAPLFDAGLSLLCSEGDKDIDIEYISANPFAPLQHYQLALVQDLSWFKASVLSGVADEMCAMLAQSKNRYLDAERLSFIHAYIESGIDTVAALAEQKPCTSPAEVEKRAQMIKVERTRQMKTHQHGRFFSVDGTAGINA